MPAERSRAAIAHGPRPLALPIAVLLSAPLLVLAHALGGLAGTSPLIGLPLLAAGFGLQQAGAVLACARLPTPEPAAAFARGLLGAGLLLLLALGLGLVLLAWPFSRLLASGELLPVLLFCGGASAAGLIASRAFADAVLLMLPEPPTRRSLGQHLARAHLQAQRLFEHGWIGLPAAAAGAALLLLQLAPALLALSAHGGRPSAWLTVGLAAHALLLAPLAALALARLVQSRLLAAQAAPEADAEAEALQAMTPAAAVDAANAAAADAEPPAPEDSLGQLYSAARRGDVERALALLESGGFDSAEPEPPEGRDQRGLAVLASLVSDLRLLRALILRGADLNHGRAGLSPLLAATRDSYHGRPDAVAMLLANGADPRQTDAEGRGPLQFAARSSDPAVAAQLLDAGALIDAVDRHGRSPLFEACAAGSWRLARFLLERGARCEPDGGQPALLAAASGGDDPVGVELLLRHKAKVDACGRLGRSALLEACLAGNALIAAVLLKAGADPGRADQQGVSPLMEAARAGAVAAVEALRRKSPPVDAVDAGGRSALLVACVSARACAETVTRLLQMGASSELRCASGLNALEAARSAQRWDLIARIDPDHPLPAAVDDDEAGAASEQDAAEQNQARDRLTRALRRGRPDLLPALLRELRPAPALLLELFDSLGTSQPRAALMQLASALPQDGPQSRDTLLPAALTRAAIAPEALEALLQLGTPVGGGGLLARYLSACRDARLPPGPDQTRALRLLESGADAFGTDAEDTPLQLAVQLGWPDLREALLARGADPQLARRGAPCALLSACQRRDSEAIKALLRAGAAPERRGPDGQTPLGLAINLGEPELLRWLEWPRWPHPGRALRDADLIAAAEAGDAQAVGCLLELRLDPQVRDARGCSALLRAAGAGHAEVVAVLLAAGLDPAPAADSGMTALAAAISQGHAEVVELLLAGGAHLEQSLPGALRPLMLAAALGQAGAARLLIAAGAETGAIDADGNGALHHAARFGCLAADADVPLAVLRALSPGAESLGLSNALGETPLLLLLGAAQPTGAPLRAEALLPQLNALLELGSPLDHADQRGFSALHWAAQHGLLTAVQRLLRAGADSARRDGLARTPGEVALTRGYVDIARELEGPKAPPSMARLLRTRSD